MAEPAPLLCINSGSSSLKFALYVLNPGREQLVARGAVEDLGGAESALWLETDNGTVHAPPEMILDHHAAIAAMFELFSAQKLEPPRAVGHRLVSGGPKHVDHCLIDETLLRDLHRAVCFAPLHLPASIDAIEAVSRHYPHLPQIACLDTAFHARMPELAARYALPRYLWDEGVRKYGFHGLSYEFILSDLPPNWQKRRLIIAHLGNGASMAAVHDGVPVDTTMGLTPTGGFMMGTRSGDLDPGVLLYLLNEKSYTPETLATLLNSQSGLLGVSENSPDMRLLLRSRAIDRHADQAIDMFCYQARKTIGALAATMDGLDMLIFTGGIGERAPSVREAICDGLQHLGIFLEPAANRRNVRVISSAAATVNVHVIPTHEDLMIARHSHRLLTSAKR